MYANAVTNYTYDEFSACADKTTLFSCAGEGARVGVEKSVGGEQVQQTADAVEIWLLVGDGYC